MQVPPKAFQDLGLHPGAILYFVNDEMEQTSEPHYHVLVVRAQGNLVMVAFTTKFDTCRRYVTLHGYPMETLVTVMPSKENGLKKESHLNCNSCFERSPQELHSMYIQGKLKISGILEDRYFAQIALGLHCSPDVSDYVKEALPPEFLPSTG